MILINDGGSLIAEFIRNYSNKKVALIGAGSFTRLTPTATIMAAEIAGYTRATYSPSASVADSSGVYLPELTVNITNGGASALTYSYVALLLDGTVLALQTANPDGTPKTIAVGATEPIKIKLTFA